MGRRGIKIPPEQKLEYAIKCCNNEISISEASRQLEIDISTIRWWVKLYRAQGACAFNDDGSNRVYSAETRRLAVLSYLNGEGSYRVIAAKHGLRSDLQLRMWVKMYNDGVEFKYETSGERHMNASRKTAPEERLEIVKDCLSNGTNYGKTALKYNVSYNQVLYWVKRFKEFGEAGLEDRRGKRKASQEPRSEVEKLQIENEKLKHELLMTKMERDLLKKVKELERKDLYRK